MAEATQSHDIDDREPNFLAEIDKFLNGDGNPEGPVRSQDDPRFIAFSDYIKGYYFQILLEDARGKNISAYTIDQYTAALGALRLQILNHQDKKGYTRAAMVIERLFSGHSIRIFEGRHEMESLTTDPNVKFFRDQDLTSPSLVTRARFAISAELDRRRQRIVDESDTQ